jgi:hypothetical protein
VEEEGPHRPVPGLPREEEALDPEWEKALTDEIWADLAKAVDAAEQTPAPAVDTMF